MSEQAIQPNRLINETSPYLLQHAYNPVNWYPYGPEAFERAKEEDKPLLISIGYSACHWCHVMAHESFESEELAAIMNEQFIPVKVDREERPDVDQLYIDAVSLMTGRAGWPLNVFTLPDGRPIFGGTYFPKDNWREICNKITEIYRDQQEEVLDYADKLADGIQQINIIEPPETPRPVDYATLNEVFEKMRSSFDTTYGGRATAPKFPLPDNYRFLLHYYARNKRDVPLQHVNRSLTQMAQGGIYDQLGGGFARYSTDEKWKVPHFEKMLYDNAQLLSLYTEAYQLTGRQDYKQVVEETIAFLEREMRGPAGGFYSALDADTEGEEGKFYTWTEEQIDEVLTDPDENALARRHFGIGGDGHWEGGKHVLQVIQEAEQLAADDNRPAAEVRAQLQAAKARLFQARESRTRPGVDDKVLLSWNALTLKGLVDAYITLEEPHYLELAKANLDFLLANMVEDFMVYRTHKDGTTKIQGFLDDYALLIQALLSYYSATFEEDKLQLAYQLQQYVDEHFYDSNIGLYQYTARNNPALISQKFEVSDNVIASPNSVTALNLYYLGTYFSRQDYRDTAAAMLQAVHDQWVQNPYFFSNWGVLATHLVDTFYEVAITGPDAVAKRQQLAKAFAPHRIVAGTTQPGSELPVLQDRYQEDHTQLYVCEDTLCQQPTPDPSAALRQMDAIQKP